MYNYDELIKEYDNPNNSIWAYPPHIFEYKLPKIGFKIHVSATILNAADIFVRVQKVLSECSVSYKVISSLKNLSILNSGDFGYSQVGKFITIYPKDAEVFSKVIELLYHATLVFQSVDIPSDFRYKNSRVIFYPYGELSLPNPDEKLQDKRLREIPENIAVPIEDFYIKRYENFPSNYTPLICMRARGKSRVFHGIDTLNNIPIVIKEGLMLGEVSLDGYDGANSVMQEQKILLTVSDIRAFPSLIDYFYVGSSFVVIEEYKEGKTLKEVLESEKCSQITLQRDNILLQLIDIFIILERRQIFIGDLSPDNIILSSNGEISLIDVEYYRFHQQEIPHALGTSGFWCSKYSDNHATIYAFFALWYYLSFPSEYQKLLLKQEPMYDCNIERYQSICEDMPAIIEIKDYKTILKILRDYIIGGK